MRDIFLVFTAKRKSATYFVGRHLKTGRAFLTLCHCWICRHHLTPTQTHSHCLSAHLNMQACSWPELQVNLSKSCQAVLMLPVSFLQINCCEVQSVHWRRGQCTEGQKGETFGVEWLLIAGLMGWEGAESAEDSCTQEGKQALWISSLQQEVKHIVQRWQTAFKGEGGRGWRVLDLSIPSIEISYIYPSSGGGAQVCSEEPGFHLTGHSSFTETRRDEKTRLFDFYIQLHEWRVLSRCSLYCIQTLITS